MEPLYQLKNIEAELLDRIAAGFASDAEANELYLKLELNSDQQEAYLSDICSHIKNLEAEAEILALEVARLNARKFLAKRFADELKQMIGQVAPKWSNLVHRIKTRKSKRTEQIDGFTIDDLPSPFVRIKQVKEPDKDLIAQTIDGGGQVPGWQRIEHLNVTVE